MSCFQVVSDLHLEFHTPRHPIIKPVAPILILAGDIGQLKHSNLALFLDYVQSNWRLTLYVLGNHEFYNKRKSMDALRQSYAELLSIYPNIYLLDNSTYTDPDTGFHFIGSTLWSNIGADCDWHDLNDFKYISRLTGGVSSKGKPMRNPISPTDMRQWNATDRDFLAHSIADSQPASKVFVITHFMPLQNKDIPGCKYPASSMDSYYGNDLYELLPKVDFWISGHTHQVFDIPRGAFSECRWICNAYGYPGELPEKNPEVLYTV